jgi:putative SOS response-associated peptidase YedK
VCGRFTLTTPGEALAEAFGLDEVPELEARYNIAPTQAVLAVRRRSGGPGREAVRLDWGLSRPGERTERPMINARSETAARLPSFRDAFRSRRCLIPADGFYEWRREGRRRQPYYVRRQDGAPLAFAGLWEPGRQGPGRCTILTTQPNELLLAIHDRMPAILAPADHDRWLDPAAEAPAPLLLLLRPYPAAALMAYPVDPWVNDAAHDGPACIEPQRRLL